MVTQFSDLSRLLIYFKELQKVIDDIFPEEITWENAYDYNYDLSDFDHPKWVYAHFPLDLVIYRLKAGKLRDSKSWKVMYQNNFNVMVQTITDPNCFGIHYRKNKHKGFHKMIAAIRLKLEDVAGIYGDRVKPRKFKNFLEFQRLEYPESLEIRALCEVLQENYKCDSTGPLKLF